MPFKITQVLWGLSPMTHFWSWSEKELFSRRGTIDPHFELHFLFIFEKIFHSQNPHWAFYCGKLGLVNHPPQKTINFIQLKHSMDWAWHFDEITPLLLIIYEHPPFSSLLLHHHLALPARRGGSGGIVPLNCSLGFIECNLWVNLYESKILQLIQNWEQ